MHTSNTQAKLTIEFKLTFIMNFIGHNEESKEKRKTNAQINSSPCFHSISFSFNFNIVCVRILIYQCNYFRFVLFLNLHCMHQVYVSEIVMKVQIFFCMCVCVTVNG